MTAEFGVWRFAMSVLLVGLTVLTALPAEAAPREKNDIGHDFYWLDGHQFKGFEWRAASPGGSCNKSRDRFGDKALFTCYDATALVTYRLTRPKGTEWTKIFVERRKGHWPDRSRWDAEFKGRRAIVTFTINPQGRGGVQTWIETVYGHWDYYVPDLDSLFPMGAAAEACPYITEFPDGTRGCDDEIMAATVTGDPRVDYDTVYIPVHLENGEDKEVDSRQVHWVDSADGRVYWPTQQIRFPPYLR